MKVTIQSSTTGDAITTGTIEWNGTDFILDPDNEIMQGFLDEPVFVSEGGQLRDVFAQDEPEVFMENLPKHYKSAACRAIKS